MSEMPVHCSVVLYGARKYWKVVEISEDGTQEDGTLSNDPTSSCSLLPS